MDKRAIYGYDRPDFTAIHLAHALSWSRRATCPRLHAGIVIADDNHQERAHGYNGALGGQPDCYEEGCLMVDGHCLRTLHSEENALIFATRRQQSLEGCTAYISARPCQKCTKLMIQAGIKAIYYWRPYNTDQVKDQVEEMLERAGVPIIGPMQKDYPLSRLFSTDGVTL